MSAGYFIDVVQLARRDGILSLNQPIKPRPQPIADLSIQLQQLLRHDNAEQMMFGFQCGPNDVRLTLTASELRWIERSRGVIAATIVTFDTGILTENGVEIPTRNRPAFIDKMTLFLSKLASGEVRVRIKLKEPGQ